MRKRRSTLKWGKLLPKPNTYWFHFIAVVISVFLSVVFASYYAEYKQRQGEEEITKQKLSKNGLIAFIRDGKAMLINPVTGEEREISDNQCDSKPIFSYDGKKIAFISGITDDDCKEGKYNLISIYTIEDGRIEDYVTGFDTRPYIFFWNKADRYRTFEDDKKDVFFLGHDFESHGFIESVQFDAEEDKIIRNPVYNIHSSMSNKLSELRNADGTISLVNNAHSNEIYRFPKDSDASNVLSYGVDGNFDYYLVSGSHASNGLYKLSGGKLTKISEKTPGVLINFSPNFTQVLYTNGDTISSWSSFVMGTGLFLADKNFQNISELYKESLLITSDSWSRNRDYIVFSHIDQIIWPKGANGTDAFIQKSLGLKILDVTSKEVITLTTKSDTQAVWQPLQPTEVKYIDFSIE